MKGVKYMFGLIAAAVTTSAWGLFTEGALLGATAYAVGKGISDK